MTDTTSQTALDAIKAAYPAQYYGSYDSMQTLTTLTAVVDVWSAKTLNGGTLDLLTLPAASDLLALTAEQFALASSASYIWVQGGALLYPARYYASYDTTASQPTAVTGWYDAWAMSSTASVPAATAMVAITVAEWSDTSFRLASGKGVQSGAIVNYTAPAAAVPLTTQAATALATARTYVYNNYGIFNEDTPAAWITYIKALMAIINGTDTTSTALPASPLDSTAYTLTGATTGTAGTATTLSLAANNSGPAAVTEVTLSDGSAGGKFSSPTVTLPAGSSAVQTVTYTPAAAGTVTISGTNTGGLTNPSDLSVTVAAT